MSATEDPIVAAFKTVSENSMAGDRALLTLIEKLIERFDELELRIELLEDNLRQREGL